MRPKVMVLCEGMIRRDGKVVLEAHSSSTLVLAGDERIVVDTSSRDYRDRVLQGLRHAGVQAGEVTMLVSTHAHRDHRGNDDLFPHARPVAASAEGRVGEELPLAEGVRLVSTPGHTPESASVFVRAELNYAIVGDAVPIRDNFVKWVPPAANYDPAKALESMDLIRGFADIVVPGHGAAFAWQRISSIRGGDNGKGAGKAEG